jgi:hypothetical protein
MAVHPLGQSNLHHTVVHSPFMPGEGVGQVIHIGFELEMVDAANHSPVHLDVGLEELMQDSMDDTDQNAGGLMGGLMGAADQPRKPKNVDTLFNKVGEPCFFVVA